MNQEETIVSVNGTTYIIPDAATAFGDMPENLRNELIKATADDIATQQYLDHLTPLIVPSNPNEAECAITGRRRGLKALGVSDVDAEIEEAMKRYLELDTDAQVQRMLQFMC